MGKRKLNNSRWRIHYPSVNNEYNWVENQQEIRRVK